MANEPNIYQGDIEEMPIQRYRTLHSSDLLPGIVEQRHIKEGLLVYRGLIADIPDGSSWVQAYYAEDESKLYIWNRVNEAWESATHS